MTFITLKRIELKHKLNLTFIKSNLKISTEIFIRYALNEKKTLTMNNNNNKKFFYTRFF